MARGVRNGFQRFPSKINENQQVLNPTPLNPAPATCHKRKRKLRCSFRNAALQKLHCNIGFSAVQKSLGPKAALQQTKNCTATSKKLRCRKVALSCRFPAGVKPPRLGTHVSDLLRETVRRLFVTCDVFTRYSNSFSASPATAHRVTPTPRLDYNPGPRACNLGCHPWGGQLRIW